MGSRLRAERERQNLSLRALARRLDMSPSMISQIECGRAMPSVGTLFAIATELNVPLDQLFSDNGAAAKSKTPRRLGTARDMVQRHDQRQSLRLENSVRWERLTAHPDDRVEFVHVVYEPGAMSAPRKKLMRHGGKEYGFVISGRLGIQVGKESVTLGPGDSISFDSQLPHRLWTIGGEPAVAIWFITDRTGDPRIFTGGVAGSKPTPRRSRESAAERAGDAGNANSTAQPRRSSRNKTTSKTASKTSR